MGGRVHLLVFLNSFWLEVIWLSALSGLSTQGVQDTHPLRIHPLLPSRAIDIPDEPMWALERGLSWRPQAWISMPICEQILTCCGASAWSIMWLTRCHCCRATLTAFCTG